MGRSMAFGSFRPVSKWKIVNLLDVDDSDVPWPDAEG